MREINHEELHTAVVTNVIVSNDGRECRIWVDAPETTIEKLNGEYRSKIQQAFTKKFARKVVPRLTFLKDTGEIERMEALLGDGGDETDG